jgi:hypothetical protein
MKANTKRILAAVCASTLPFIGLALSGEPFVPGPLMVKIYILSIVVAGYAATFPGFKDDNR